VAGTGAFLLLAAAAVFVAVHWDRIPSSAKLGIVVGLTGACIGASRRLRPSLPATSSALLHLGAFLIPVDVAAVGLNQSASGDTLLLAEGLICSAAFLGLAALSRSKLLSWAADGAVVAAAAGVAVTTSVPFGLALVGGAVVAHVVGRWPAAVVWSVLAGGAPLLGTEPWWSCLSVGVVAGAVLAAQAVERDDPELGFTAMVAALVGGLSAWAVSDRFAPGELVVPAGVFLGVEVVALFASRDSFWRKPAAWLAVLAEWVAAPAVAAAAVTILISVVLSDGFFWDPTVCLFFAVTAGGWYAAALRRGEVGAKTTAAAALCAVAASSYSADARIVAATALAVAVGLVVRRWRFDVFTASVLATVAVAVARSEPGLALVVGAVAVAVVVRGAQNVAAATLATGLVLATAAAVRPVLYEGGVVVVGMFGLWAVSAWLDRTNRDAARISRAAIIVPLANAVVLLPHSSALAVGLLAVLLFAIDAVRHDSPELAFGSALALQVVVGELAAVAGLELPAVGVACAVAALVWTGLAAVAEERWQPPFLAAAAGGVGVGLFLSAGDARSFSDVLVIAGALVLSLGAARRSDVAAHGGGLLMVAGTLGHLSAIGVHQPEAYALPIALYLLVAGHLTRRADGVSSWRAYAPSVLVLGGSALVARMDGGSAWHAVVAGGVGVVAVALGGWYRLAGPLFSGTGLAVAVTLYESQAPLASVPTWAWLAAGGSALLTVGVALERNDTSPVEAGRRLVDVVTERFS
jgi:hypothetical protein